VFSSCTWDVAELIIGSGSVAVGMLSFGGLGRANGGGVSFVGCGCGCGC